MQWNKPEKGGTTLCVLIADDDQPTVDAIASAVHWAEMGIGTVLRAYNIDQAKQIITTRTVDLIISDIEMPKGSGLDLLHWYRQSGGENEFILLTCHENFSYASKALHDRATEYLLKPFSVEVMEVALRRIVLHKSEQDQLRRENRRKMQAVFWNDLLEGHYEGNPGRMQKAMQEHFIEDAVSRKYQLVVSRITDLDRDLERFGRELLLFALENIHAEILSGQLEPDYVFSRMQRDCLVLITICPEQEARRIEEQCQRLILSYQRVMQGVMTCCISQPCAPDQFCRAWREAFDQIGNNVAKYGSWFHAATKSEQASTMQVHLDLKRLKTMLAEQDKKQILEYLKARMEERLHTGTLTETSLHQMQTELTQAVHAYLALDDIQISVLQQGGSLADLEQKASQSMLDFVLWASFLLTTAFGKKQELEQQQTLSQKVQRYIRAHFSEPIDRNSIAASMYLSPEHLGKMYKKETGTSIKDYLTEYRLQKARELLKTPGIRISDAALAVGFDNFTYFSTMFKKQTGLTPNEYRKQMHSSEKMEGEERID